MGASAAAPLNPCLADPQPLAAVHPFLAAAEVGLLETTIFVQFAYENKMSKILKQIHDKAKIFISKKVMRMLAVCEKLQLNSVN